MNYVKKTYNLLFILIISTVLVACSRPTVPTDYSSHIIQGVNFVGLSVASLEESVDFYAATNLKPVEHEPFETRGLFEALGRSDLSVSIQLLRGANAQVLLMQFDQSSELPTVGVSGQGIAHICYQVNKTTKTYQNLLQAGAKVIGDRDMIQLSSRNPVKYAYVNDLDGAIVEVEHVDVEALNLPAPPKNDYRVRHVALTTQNIAGLRKFYAKLLQQPKPRRLGRFIKLKGEKADQVSGLPGSKLEMAFFQVRNLELEMAQYYSHPTPALEKPRPVDAPGYNMVVFDVIDLQRASDHFVQSGGSLVGAAVDFLGVQTQFGRDPDGNLIGLQVSHSNSLISAKNFADNGI